LHAALRTAADDHAVPHGDHSASSAEAHRDDLRDVVGFNEGGWMDMAGDPHTDRLHVIERYTRKDLYTLRYEATIDDPGTYTEPWTIGFDILWDDQGEIQEYICQENSTWMRRMLNEIRDPAVKPR
jgi:hypothetical protein